MTKITIQEGLDVEPEELARLEAHLYFPGEKVRVDPTTKFYSDTPESIEARIKEFSGRDLLIIETIVAPALNGWYEINYVFDEMDGLHNTLAFMNPEGYEHRYGVLITRNDETWLVPLSDDYESPVAGQPNMIDAKMTRLAHYCFNIDGAENTIEGYLSSHQDAPAAGEYYVIPRGDNHWALDNSPWMSGASDRQIEVAEQAINAYMEQMRGHNEQDNDYEQQALASL